MLCHVISSFPDSSASNEVSEIVNRNVYLVDFQHQKFKIEKYEAAKILHLKQKLKANTFFLNKENFLKLTCNAESENSGLEEADPNAEKEKPNEQPEPEPEPEPKTENEKPATNDINQKKLEREKNPFLNMDLIRPNFQLDYVILNYHFDYMEILKRIICFMKSNCRVIIHDRFLDKITQVYNFLKNHKNFILVEVSDFMVRDYQVYNMRTHPTMRGPLNEGYYLTAYKVD